MEASPLDVELRSSTANTIRTKLSDSSRYVLGGDGVVVPELSTVKDSQLRLITENQQLYVAPGSAAQILVNGKPATERTPVHNGDWITVGGVVYQIKLSGNVPGSPPPSSAASVDLSVSAPASGGGPRTAPPGGIQVLIGREKGCTLTIDSPMVSREHARLLHEGGQWSIEDLGSTNGTFVNGKKLQGRTVLRPGDQVSIATFRYRFTGDALMADGG